ncbi:MAG: beta-ketoacyl-[acyl-carrier-protein] synthase family protein [Cyclobacteriaceae bacterium]
MEKHRVVITGIGVVASNAIGATAFEEALREGKSGIRYWDELEKLNFRCQLGGRPQIDEINLDDHLPKLLAAKLTNKGIIYACLSGLEAWKDAGLEPSGEEPDYNSGIVFGAGALGYDSWINRENPQVVIDRGEPRKIGSRSVSEGMNSGAASYLNQILGLANRSQSNSSACITGSESVLLGYEYLAAGRAKRMLCGSTEGDGRYLWGPFDAMRVLCSDSNDRPTFGSRPMSSTSSGFVASGGSGALVLETLESAKKRNAKIYAEILGGHVNSGGLRKGGTMTASNSDAVVECIKSAAEVANIRPEEVDLISGHLTSTKGDPIEIRNWSRALGLDSGNFPLVNTPKSMIGHSIAGAGSIELVACVLQIYNNFVHTNINVDEIHPEILEIIPEDRIPRKSVEREVNTVMKANFGFGDLNCALVIRKFKE